jgi:RNA polymerase sigma-70 factor (family 1)
MTEEDLITGLSKGERTAFQQLYNQYYTPLCTYSKRFTKSKEIAEEVVQDVFLKLWERQGRFMITTSLKAYLFASVRNHCLDHLKHLQIVHKFNEYYTLLLKEAEDLYIFSQESGDSMTIAQELEESVREAIDSLPVQCQRIFKMSRFDGLKHKDIADKMGVTVNTVQRQMSIALKKLRDALEKYLTVIVLLLKLLVP